MRQGGVKPELECFDLGHVANAEPLVRWARCSAAPVQLRPRRPAGRPAAETLKGGAIDRSRGHLEVTASAGRRKRSVPPWPWGNRWVGLEDNFYLDAAGTEMARGNGPLVEKAVRMARDVGREPMSPVQAREALSIPLG